MRVAWPAILPAYSGLRSPRNSSTSRPSFVLFASGRSRRGRYSSDSRPPGTLPSTNTASGAPAAAGTSGSKPSTSRACASVVRSPTAGGRGGGAGGRCSRRSTVAPRSPKNSSTECAHARHGGEDAAGEDQQCDDGDGEGSAEAAGGSSRSRRRRERGRVRAHADRGREVGRGRPVELAAQLGELTLQVGHASTSSPSSARRRSSARDTRDLTVPRGQSSAAAVSSSDSSRR